MNRKLSFFIAGLLLVFCAMILRPVPSPTPENTITISAEVKDIWKGGVNDIVFSFKSSDKLPYLNRGLELGFDIDELKEKLIGKTTHFKLIDHWTPLDLDKSSPPVAYIETSDGEVLFDVIK